jgi:hypothetical protein
MRCAECGCVWCRKCVEEGTEVARWEDGMRRSYVVSREEEDGGSGGVARAWEVEPSRGMGRRRGLDGEKWRGWKWESCKPWRGSRCKIYHEHNETEVCPEETEEH